MGFNPLQEKGMPLANQLRTYSDVSPRPWDPREVHPFTRCRAILMGAIEAESARFSHHVQRHQPDPQVRRRLALLRRLERQQQMAVSWLIPADESELELAIGHEQTEIELAAAFARGEPDPRVKAALEFALAEDFDHLYRWANLLDLFEGRRAEGITGGLTEIMPGRPTARQHRHPLDEIGEPIDRTAAAPSTLLHVPAVVALEQQTLEFYLQVGHRQPESLSRELVAEIAEVEEQHLTRYASLVDPRAAWSERLLTHELTEVWLYWSLAQDEPDDRIRRLWERHLEMEITHLQEAAELLARVERRDPSQLIPAELPEPFRFASDLAHVRGVLARQARPDAAETRQGRPDEAPDDERYRRYQHDVGADGTASVRVIDKHFEKFGHEYRQELKGPHPVKELRARQAGT